MYYITGKELYTNEQLSKWVKERKYIYLQGLHVEEYPIFFPIPRRKATVVASRRILSKNCYSKAVYNLVIFDAYAEVAAMHIKPQWALNVEGRFEGVSDKPVFLVDQFEFSHAPIEEGIATIIAMHIENRRAIRST